MKFIIYAASYTDDIGGIIVLHKLCHLLNELGHEASFFPVLRPRHAALRRAYANLTARVPLLIELFGKGFRLNPAFNTRMLPLGADTADDETVTIYGEMVSGNPLGARNIVRWFLHKPGFHTNVCNYGEGEFHVDFNEFLSGYDPGPNYLSPSGLHVVHFPMEIYNEDGALPQEDRTLIAYCIRKGALRTGIIDPDTAFCIDGLSHRECADVLKRTKTFYSFDPYTAFSWFASLCGAVSVVIPTPGMTREEWYSKDEDRYGIAFGQDQEELEWACATRHLRKPDLENRQNQSRDKVARFVDEAATFFSLPKGGIR